MQHTKANNTTIDQALHNSDIMRKYFEQKKLFVIKQVVCVMVNNYEKSVLY